MTQRFAHTKTTWAILAALVVCPMALRLSAADDIGSTITAKPAGQIVMKVVMIEDEDEQPAAAGKAAAAALEKAMGGVPLKAVLVSECFEDRQHKQELLEGVCSALPAQLVLGGATYGSFAQSGCTDYDSVCLLGIGGDGIGVSTALVTEMGTSKLVLEEHQDLIEQRLQQAGAKLAGNLRRTDRDRLLILLADAHSPKNQYLVEGAQQVVGAAFPITGGSANKNAGQTFVYFQGKMHQDSAVALMLSGDFRVAMAGRQAKDNDAVIATAKTGAAEAMAALDGKPTAVLAFNCAGRRGKLKNMDDELAAMQQAIGGQLPLFGCYCAGEVGPVDASEKQPGVLCGGSGWHVMFTIIGRP
ncbi:MAG: FIST C-terminal domain-containing protein [Pirellulales bacterium]|nr:FIST C-terminal domain-containing protein [Pirellulales bacterium]